MRDQEALLQAIREAPEEDAPRLVYADWLEEHGDPDGAEFITLQVQRARQPGEEASWRYLPPREEELLRKNQKAWLGPLARWKGEREFRRGLLEHLTLENADVFLRQRARICAEAPLLRSLCLTIQRKEQVK